MIVDEKCFIGQPPPPYPEQSMSSSGKTLTSLSPHLLIQIVLSTFPLQDGLFSGDSRQELQRQNFLWIHSSLRFVNRDLYLACMNVLRSAYLPAFTHCIRVPYSSDPFPSSLSSDSSLLTPHRELRTLDLFIALIAHEDVLIDASSLHLPREDAYKDLFELIQPRSRLEDLVAEQGRKHGVITVEDHERTSAPSTPVYLSRQSTMSIYKSEYPTSTASSSPYTFSPPPSTTSIVFSPPTLHIPAPSSGSTFSIKSIFRGSVKFKSKPQTLRLAPPSQPSTPRRKPIQALPFSSLSISFTPRKVSLIYTPPSRQNTSAGPSSAARKHTIVEVSRTREDSLEFTAKKLVRELKLWLQDDAS